MDSLTGSTPSPGSRRGNGLAAAEWGPLGELDSRLSTELLGRLAAVGVAAYVEPAAGLPDPLYRSVRLPSRPLDRLYVDRQRAEEARKLLAELTGSALPATTPPGEAALPADPDEVFRQIVAAWEQDGGTPAPQWPGLAAGPAPAATGLPAWLEPDALDDDGHFVPPPPPRLPRFRARTVIAWLAVALGFLLLFSPGAVAQQASLSLEVFGMTLMAGGAAGLVLGMRDAPPDGHEPDDGAVV